MSLNSSCRGFAEILDLLKNGTHLVIDAVAGNVQDGGEEATVSGCGHYVLSPLTNVVLAEVYSRLVQLDSARIGIEIEEMNDKGVRVKDVVAGGAAAKSGQVRIGDHILQINGVDVSQVIFPPALRRVDNGNPLLWIRSATMKRSKS